MTQNGPRGLVLFCYDGSEGSLAAMRTAGELIEHSAEAVVLTVWEPIAVRLALGGAFMAAPISNEGELDEQEETFAKATAEEGAQRAIEHGYKASAVTRESTEGTARAILALADEISARLLVCGQRGRGPLKTALLGSVSHTLAAHTRPVLIAPATVEQSPRSALKRRMGKAELDQRAQGRASGRRRGASLIQTATEAVGEENTAFDCTGQLDEVVDRDSESPPSPDRAAVRKSTTSGAGGPVGRCTRDARRK